MAYCSKCGQELKDGDKFCSKCGAPVEQGSPKIQPKREQTYAGKIVKCPNCGETLDAFVTVCPSCGYELRGAGSSSAVQEFASLVSNTKSDREKINIIRNFPIPNTKEDVLEFVILASTNINENQNLDDEVSDAWFAKLQQAYQKASLSFKNQPEFERVENVYNEVKASRDKNQKIKRATGLIHNKNVHMALFVVLVLIIAGMGMIFTGGSKNSKSSSKTDTYEWPTTGYSQYLPVPTIEYGKIQTDNDKKFAIRLYNVTQDLYTEYLKECKEAGFTIDPNEKSSGYTAYNEDHFYLDIYYYSSMKELSVSIEPPLEMFEIRWPDSTLVAQIPKPSSSVGHIDTEKTGQFIVYIDNMTLADFNTYVDKCMALGFNVDYSRKEKDFRAYNEAGYYLVVEEKTFDIMYINIKEPKEDKN